MKREAARHEQIAKSESDLRTLRESFVAKQDDLLRHKKAIESEY
jgi:ribosomal protein L35